MSTNVSITPMSTGPTAPGAPERRLDPRVRRTRSDVRRTAGELLLEAGLDAVTHAKVAAEAGYSRATIYAHWPRQIDLIVEAFKHYGAIPHHEPTGDLRADLIGELTKFRTVLVDRGLGRILSTVAARATSDPELAELRDAIVADGTRVIGSILDQHGDEDQTRVSTAVLVGTIFYLSTMTDEPISDDTIAGIVDRAIG